MKIVIVGAGAVGCLFGGYLARAGFDVTLLGRPQQVEVIAEHGLRISGHDDFYAYPRAVSDPAQVRNADLLIFSVRSTSMARAIADVGHLKPEMLITFGNGIGKYEPLIECFGPGPVVGCSTIMASRLVEPGHARCTIFGHTWFGELDRHPTPRLDALTTAWQRAGLHVELVDNIAAVEWSKLAYLVPISMLSALTRLPYHQILQTPDLAYLFVQMAREVKKVAGVRNIEIRDYPGINSRTLVDTPFDRSVQLLIARGRALEAAGQVDISTNILSDITLGRRTENESIAGDVVRQAQEAGLSLPAISFAYRLVRGIDASARN